MSKEVQTLPVDKSEILFLYESSYCIPNGDPFTGEQRYDEETKKILVSDVRIKRYVRDYLLSLKNGYEIYVVSDLSAVAEGKKEKKMSGAAARINVLRDKYKNDKSIVGKDKEVDILKLMQKCIDVRLFGGISTEVGDAVNLTGPVQFALLNPSLNSVDLRMHQNTSVFVSSTEKTRGAIGTTTVVPYALNQIHGWINPYSAVSTGLTKEDIETMLKALWDSVNNANTRTKSNKNSLLLLHIVYAEPTKKLYYLDKMISLKPSNRALEEQIREFSDYTLDFSKLSEAANTNKVKQVRFYTENETLKQSIQKLGDKFGEILL